MAETINATRVRLGALESGESDAADAVHSVYNSDVSAIEAAVQAAAEDLAPAGGDVGSVPAPAQ
jgi:hypothetical protein